MTGQSYLQWLSASTKTHWWCDSGTPSEIEFALQHGAVGVTTNPPLVATAIGLRPEIWKSRVGEIIKTSPDPGSKAEAFVHLVVTEGAKRLYPIFTQSSKQMGYICAQVDPSKAGNRDAMRTTAKRFSQWGPNISIKLPATSAGLEIIEECAAEGIPVTGTVSFTVPQMLAVAEAHRRGSERAVMNGKVPAPCNAVLMIGRIDDYLTEVAADNQAKVSVADLQQAGLAIAKRTYSLFVERGYKARILVAAMRGTYHATELAGADLTLSIQPKYQHELVEHEIEKEERYAIPIDPEVIGRLSSMKEFVRAYEPDGLSPREFVSFGVTQRTLSQFTETGWKQLESIH
ncbi:MAG TPA: transaldolase family protein [Spirochaetales bacterium]|nr:transaldolase family protein [Spirochaetales bacterium]